jgi:NAD(P)-dependent dehydrogenase (short-subunit alcohol dehydrogenase family)
MTGVAPSTRVAQKNVLIKTLAAAMLFLCSSEASAMTGQAINVTGGLIMT